MEHLVYVDFEAGGFLLMGENQVMALESERKKKDYFEYGNVKIIISEHFSENGNTMQKIVEDAVLRDGRFRTENVQ